MTDAPKNNENRSQEITKRTNTKPFVDNPIEQKFTIIYIVRGIKHIEYGNIRRCFSAGDTICMAVGAFVIENIPDDGGRYEEIVVKYSAVELQKAITRLHLIQDIAIDDSSNLRGLKRCCGHKTEEIVASFFDEIGRRIDAGMTDEYVAGRKRELIYMLMTHADEDMINCIFDNMNPETEIFVCIIYAHIFVNCDLATLAAKCNRSLSAFKNEFYRIFHETPHRWFTVQRMKRASFLLLTTDRSIERIGDECMYSNSSHFIKVFRKYFHITPAAYRRKMRIRVMADGEEE